MKPPRPDTPRGIEPRLRKVAGEWVWRFRVRWTDPVTRRRMAEEFDTIDEAVGFHARRNELRDRGALADLGRGRRTITEFVDRNWWPDYVQSELEENTRPSYRSTWRRHLKPRVGHILLGHLDAPRVTTLREDLQRAGCKPPTVRRALVVLQSICRYAIEAGEMAANPCRDVRKPPVTRQHLPVALTADQIEAVRAELDVFDATIVSVLAYMGLRTFSENFALEERHMQSTTLLIAQRNVQGQIVLGLKTSKHRPRDHRAPTLYQIVRADIDQHLEQLGRRGPGRRKLIFPGDAGQPWAEAEYTKWVRGVFRPAAKRADVEIDRLYDLRHTCASLMLHAGRSMPEVSEYLGHSPQTLADTYAHLITDLRGVTPTPVEDQIAAARAKRNGGAHGR